MTTSTTQQTRARTALEQLLGTEEGDDSVDLFVQHHLDEIEADYWIAHLGTPTPAASAVLGLLQPREPWGDDGSVHIDFSLPGDVSQYVLSVELDEDDEVIGVSMDS